MTSRISKQPVVIPSEVKVSFDGGRFEVVGPKGNLGMVMPEKVTIKIEEGKVRVEEVVDYGHLSGMVRTMIANMVKGVVDGWSKTLELSGTGYRVSTNGSELQLALGFSHLVKIQAQGGTSFEVKENKITIKGHDKEMVGRLAAIIRKLKPADPYKAKGLKYEGEVIVRKAGKAAKAGGVAGK